MSGRRIDLSATQVIASVLAAVTGAIAASYLGVAGTIIGTAVMSVAGTAGAAIYKHVLGRGQEKLKSAAAQMSPAAYRRPRRTADPASAETEILPAYREWRRPPSAGPATRWDTGRETEPLAGPMTRWDTGRATEPLAGRRHAPGHPYRRARRGPAGSARVGGRKAAAALAGPRCGRAGRVPGGPRPRHGLRGRGGQAAGRPHLGQAWHRDQCRQPGQRKYRRGRQHAACPAHARPPSSGQPGTGAAQPVAGSRALAVRHAGPHSEPGAEPEQHAEPISQPEPETDRRRRIWLAPRIARAGSPQPARPHDRGNFGAHTAAKFPR